MQFHFSWHPLPLLTPTQSPRWSWDSLFHLYYCCYCNNRAKKKQQQQDAVSKFNTFTISKAQRESSIRRGGGKREWGSRAKSGFHLLLLQNVAFSTSLDHECFDFCFNSTFSLLSHSPSLLTQLLWLASQVKEHQQQQHHHCSPLLLHTHTHHSYRAKIGKFLQTFIGPSESSREAGAHQEEQQQQQQEEGGEEEGLSILVLAKARLLLLLLTHCHLILPWGPFLLASLMTLKPSGWMDESSGWSIIPLTCGHKNKHMIRNWIEIVSLIGFKCVSGTQVLFT